MRYRSCRRYLARGRHRRGRDSAPFLSAAARTRELLGVISRLALVADPIDRPVVVVGYQQRTIRHHVHVSWPAPELVPLQPALGKDLILWWLSGFKLHLHQLEAALLGTVPGPA